MAKIGRYTIQSKLGRGSMAQVYLVWDEVRNESVALKALLPNYVQNPNIRRRFLREAAAIKRLPHKYIIPIYDFGESDGQVYYTMQALDGGTLGDRIEEGEIADETLLFYFERIAEAVDHIHKRGVVHRDIKPNNIIFNRYGRPFLADFGVIQLNKSRTTNVGSSFIGTPAYMSPEQVMSQEVDHRADLYTLGIVLFEMLTGNVPFEGDSVMETAQMQVNAPIPKLRDFRQVDKRWQKVIEKALSKDPKKRYQSGAEMAAAVHEIVAKKEKKRKSKMVSQPARVSASSDSVVMAVPPREKRPFNWLILLPVAAVLLLISAIGVLLIPETEPPVPTTPTSTTEIANVRITPTGEPTITSESSPTSDSPLFSNCRGESGYDFEFGQPEFTPGLGADYVEDTVPTVRYRVTNHGCPLIEALIEFEALERGTPIQAFRFEDGEERKIDQLDAGSDGYLVLEFAPQTTQYLNDVWQFVINDELELSQREKIEIQERWLRLEADEVGQLPPPATNTPRPTATQIPEKNVPVPTNTLHGATVGSTSTPTSVLSTDVPSTDVPPTNVPPTNVLATATPNWNATKTQEAQVWQAEQDATRTHQAEESANNMTREAYNRIATQTVSVQQTASAQTATANAKATEWVVSQTETRQAEIVKITQTHDARPTLTHTPNYNATSTVRAQQTQNAQRATATANAQRATATANARPRPTDANLAPTARPTNTPRPTEPPFVVPVITSSGCVLANDGFVQTPFRWTGQLKTGQSFAIRIASNNQSPQKTGEFVKSDITTGNNGTTWSINGFDTGLRMRTKKYRWTVAVLERGDVLAFAQGAGCFDNTGGSG